MLIFLLRIGYFILFHQVLASILIAIARVNHIRTIMFQTNKKRPPLIARGVVRLVVTNYCLVILLVMV
jgi:hypothetical protein